METDRGQKKMFVTQLTHNVSWLANLSKLKHIRQTGKELQVAHELSTRLSGLGLGYEHIQYLYRTFAWFFHDNSAVTFSDHENRMIRRLGPLIHNLMLKWRLLFFPILLLHKFHYVFKSTEWLVSVIVSLKQGYGFKPSSKSFLKRYKCTRGESKSEVFGIFTNNGVLPNNCFIWIFWKWFAFGKKKNMSNRWCARQHAQSGYLCSACLCRCDKKTTREKGKSTDWKGAGSLIKIWTKRSARIKLL